MSDYAPVVKRRTRQRPSDSMIVNAPDPRAEFVEALTRAFLIISADVGYDPRDPGSWRRLTYSRLARSVPSHGLAFAAAEACRVHTLGALVRRFENQPAGDEDLGEMIKVRRELSVG